MIRTVKVLFCDNEHGTGDMTYPSLHQTSEQLAQYFTEGRTAKETRKAAKKEGWGFINGVDYCPLCMESEQTEFETGGEQ